MKGLQFQDQWLFTTFRGKWRSSWSWSYGN